MAQSFVVRPIDRKRAVQLCADHPHASTLPNSAKYYMVAYIGGRLAGMAAWGYGIRPRGTPNKLFGEAGRIEDYLELCRFFVYDWVPKNTPTRFLAATHRLIKKHTKVKWLYTYAAGFQGLVGYTYQAAGYDYIGKVRIARMLYIPGQGLIHPVAQWHRYGVNSPKKMLKIFPDATIWNGFNYCYIYWLCTKKEKRELLKHARFTIYPHTEFPKDDDIRVWLTDPRDGKVVREVPVEEAKSVPIVKLRSSRSPR